MHVYDVLHLFVCLFVCLVTYCLFKYMHTYIHTYTHTERQTDRRTETDRDGQIEHKNIAVGVQLYIEAHRCPWSRLTSSTMVLMPKAPRTLILIMGLN